MVKRTSIPLGTAWFPEKCRYITVISPPASIPFITCQLPRGQNATHESMYIQFLTGITDSELIGFVVEFIRASSTSGMLLFSSDRLCHFCKVLCLCPFLLSSLHCLLLFSGPKSTESHQRGLIAVF